MRRIRSDDCPRATSGDSIDGAAAGSRRSAMNRRRLTPTLARGWNLLLILTRYTCPRRDMVESSLAPP